MNKLILLLSLILSGCRSVAPVPLSAARLDPLAVRYVRLVLALGEHQAEAVDAYYGPAGLREQVKREARSLAQIRAEGEQLMREVENAPIDRDDGLVAMRRRYLRRQLAAVVARAEMAAGARFTFEEEARRLFGVTPPRLEEPHFAALIRDLERELPGEGTLAARLDGYRTRINVAPEKVDPVMRAAMRECRKRTVAHIDLPAGESFSLEYVKNKPWGGYNWYQGNYRSLIQVNIDLPVAASRGIDLACHEGYPGHHVYNVLLEKNLVHDRGWIEFSVYPLYSPQSLIAEGSANYGIEMAFPGSQWMEFDRDVLFPLAGIDPSEAARYHRVMNLTSALGYATNEAARRWIDGELTREKTVAWLMQYALNSPARAEQQMKFIEHYRSYVINYNYGRDLVKHYVESFPPEQRWEVFRRILSTPMLPQDLTRED